MNYYSGRVGNVNVQMRIAFKAALVSPVAGAESLKSRRKKPWYRGLQNPPQSPVETVSLDWSPSARYVLCSRISP